MLLGWKATTNNTVMQLSNMTCVTNTPQLLMILIFNNNDDNDNKDYYNYGEWLFISFAEYLFPSLSSLAEYFIFFRLYVLATAKIISERISSNL